MKWDRIFAAIGLMALGSSAASTAGAQQPAGPPAGYLDSFPGKGSGEPLVLDFCLVGDRICVERVANAWGQSCDSEAARDIGTGRSGSFAGWRPWGTRYAGWRCGWSGRWHDKSERVFGGGSRGD